MLHGFKKKFKNIPINEHKKAQYKFNSLKTLSRTYLVGI